jgi:ribosomal-protein-alanine N-acetyltransferase
LLEGKLVNLRVMEREDLPLVLQWINDPEFGGEYEPLEQTSMKELEKWYDNPRQDETWFIIEKKDRSKVGQIFHTPVGSHFEIGYRLIPNERNKGYCTEAVRIVVDYLFLAKNIVRIQAKTNPKNVASQKVLEKAGFHKEGLVRKDIFIMGKWQDGILYSVLKEDWKEPAIFKKATHKNS